MQQLNDVHLDQLASKAINALEDYVPANTNALVIRLKQGDEDAWEELYRLYWGPIVGYLTNRLWWTRADLEDCAQKVFVRSFESLPRFFANSDLSFKMWISWIFGIARHVSHEQIYRHLREPANTALDGLADHERETILRTQSRKKSNLDLRRQEVSRILEEVRRTGMIRDVDWAALGANPKLVHWLEQASISNAINDDDWVALVLRIILDIEEISVLLNKSYEATKKQCSRAQQRLAEFIKRNLAEQ